MNPGQIHSVLLFLMFVVSMGCTATDEKNKTKRDSVKKDPVKTTIPATPATKPAIINIIDTVSIKQIVICMKDSAASFERIAGKLGKIYGEKLAIVFKKNKIKVSGQPMAWFKSQKAPYFFEAGIPVNKKPLKLPKGVFIREMKTDSVTVAHFYGPYDLIPQAYEALKNRLKETNRKLKGSPYEIYVSDPMDKKGQPVNPYKVQTNIVFPFK